MRFFTKRKVSRDIIKQIIEAANYAPSASNKQAWRFIVIDDQAKLKRLSDEGGAYFIKDAPLAVLVLYENIIDNVEYRDHLQSASAAIQNMHLKITSLGLGSCWVANLPSKRTVRNIFNIPNNYDPIALIVIGYPKGKQGIVPRKHKSEEIISFNNFQFKEELEPYFLYKTRVRKILRKIYFFLPFSIKKILLPIIRKFEKRKF